MTLPVDTPHGPPGLPVDAAGPVFREPWEAHAFALTVTLHQHGLFSWPEWADALALQIRAAQAAGDADRTPHGRPIELRPADFKAPQT